MLLILTPDALLDGAQALVDYRSARFAIRMVRLQDIYDTFSFGLTDPAAIEAFLDHAYINWGAALEYLVLLGRGTLDHRDVLGYGESLIPLRMAATPWGITASDNRYADVDGDRKPDYLYGRISASDNSEVLDYVAKLMAFDTQSLWSSSAAVIADNPDAAGNFHANSDELMLQMLDHGYLPQQLYHPLDPVRTNLLAAWGNADYVYVNYDGHGAKTYLGSEQYLTTDDVPGLANGSHLPIFAALTCSVGDSTFPGTLGLADALVLSNSGGAIAAFAPTGLSLDVFAHAMNRAFVDSLLGWGDNISTAAAAAHEPVLDGIVIPDFMRDIYLNLGDPAVAIPE